MCCPDKSINEVQFLRNGCGFLSYSQIPPSPGPPSGSNDEITWSLATAAGFISEAEERISQVVECVLATGPGSGAYAPARLRAATAGEGTITGGGASRMDWARLGFWELAWLLRVDALWLDQPMRLRIL
jgi:hypothetical protein